MDALNPLWINRYSQVELLAFLACGYTLDDFKMCGLAEDNLQALSAVTGSAHAINDDSIFNAARNEDTVKAYRRYLELLPDGTHATECRAWVSRHESISDNLTQRLIEDMKAHPQRYSDGVLHTLIEGLHPNEIEDYKSGLHKLESLNPWWREIVVELIEGHTVDMERVAQSVKPDGMSENTWRAIWTQPSYNLPSLTAREMSRMLKWGNDVFMLGICGCGRKSLTAAILNYSALFLNGTYQPHIVNGKDVSYGYYKALRDIIPACKFPAPQGSDTLCFLHYTAMGQKATFIQHGSEVCALMADSRYREEVREIWEVNALRACLENDNEKTLLFLIDCSVLLESDEYPWTFYTSLDQALLLENMLQILCSNGPNQHNPEKGCFMSRVKKLAIVFTKADLLPGEPSVSNWLKQCEELAATKNKSFLALLHEVCSQYKINKNGQPYMFVHSMGTPLVGNCFIHQVETTKSIASFIFEN